MMVNNMENCLAVTGRYVNVKRFEIHDGDGIRTTLFLKGCPLRCLWCHNPEGLSPKAELGYYPHKCIGCGECVSACPQGAHYFENGKHVYNREKCIACGKCEEACLGNALVFYGKEITVGEILPKLTEDREFYKKSGGGVTVSGGEPLMQAEFVAALFLALKEQGINTALDSSLFAKREALEKVLPYTDTVLADVKAIDRELHKKLTGVDNTVILDNLRYLNEIGKPVEIRIPYIPGKNEDELPKIAEALSGLGCIKKVKLLAYHDLSGTKYDSINMEYPMPGVAAPKKSLMQEKLQMLLDAGLNAEL